jgi:hypothetical protein
MPWKKENTENKKDTIEDGGGQTREDGSKKLLQGETDMEDTFDIYDIDTAYKTCQYCENLFTDMDEWDDEHNCCTYCVSDLDDEMEAIFGED